MEEEAVSPFSTFLLYICYLLHGRREGHKLFMSSVLTMQDFYGLASRAYHGSLLLYERVGGFFSVNIEIEYTQQYRELDWSWDCPSS